MGRLTSGFKIRSVFKQPATGDNTVKLNKVRIVAIFHPSLKYLFNPFPYPKFYSTKRKSIQIAGFFVRLILSILHIVYFQLYKVSQTVVCFVKLSADLPVNNTWNLSTNYALFIKYKSIWYYVCLIHHKKILHSCEPFGEQDCF